MCRRALHKQHLTELAVNYILREKPSVAVFTGDATSTGQQSEFDLAWTKLEPLVKSGIPVVYVPGNHDVYVKDAACRKALENFYWKMWNGSRNFSTEPFLFKLGPLRFAVIDSAVPCSCFFSNGVMSAESTAFLQKEAAEHTAGSPLIYVGHFPLHWNRVLEAWRHGLRNADQAVALLENHQIDLSLCGHIHKSMKWLDARGRGEIVAGSVSRSGIVADIVYDAEKDYFDASFVRLTEKVR